MDDLTTLSDEHLRMKLAQSTGRMNDAIIRDERHLAQKNWEIRRLVSAELARRAAEQGAAKAE